MITERYTRWVAMLAQSDANLVLLAAIAMAVVIAWRAGGRLPAPWGGRLRELFMMGALCMLLQFVAGASVTYGFAAVMGFIGGIAWLGNAWLAIRRRTLEPKT